ncbi:hypothetical protein HASA104033_05780 [Halobacterium salinarum]|nr:hypothetical protein [Halobacterium salinarum]QCC44129.1 uncharacterized protein HBSAL_02000 [Halobacterium salinarum]CAP13109.2 uncharacterized protein OE_1409F [Halobacterium salinarum R1]DAC77543.1 TPA_inf: uncharacterized protein VNG_0261H [Halobacterium salinarum NRC-1]
MSTDTPTVGVDHPTVVPLNFDADAADTADADADTDHTH